MLKTSYPEVPRLLARRLPGHHAIRAQKLACSILQASGSDVPWLWVLRIPASRVLCEAQRLPGSHAPRFPCSRLRGSHAPRFRDSRVRLLSSHAHRLRGSSGNKLSFGVRLLFGFQLSFGDSYRSIINIRNTKLTCFRLPGSSVRGS